MARRLFIDTTSDNPASAFVKSFTESSAANSPVIARSDSFTVQLHFLAQSQIARPGQPFVYVDPSAWPSVRFAMGPIGALPDSGTFTLTSSLGLTTGNLAFNANAATVQAALQGLTGLGAATVTSTVTGTWLVDSQSTANATLAITGTGTALAPSGSTVQITKTQTATATSPGLTNRWTIQVLKALPVLNTTWSALASALVTVTTVQAGGGGANKTFRAVWNADAYFGGVLLTFYDGTNTFTLGPIAYNAAPSDVAAAFLATGANNGVTVVQNNLGDFTISCTGSAIKNSNNPTLATSSDTLVVPVGLQGVVTASTAGVDSILNGAASATTNCEIEITRVVSQPETVAQVTNATFIADLLGNTPGFQTGGEDWATVGDVLTIAPHIFANITARNNDTPYAIGQLGVQVDTTTLYLAGNTTIGSWSSVIGIVNLRVGASGATDGIVRIYGGGGGTYYGSILTSNITSTNIIWQMPNKAGTVALLSDISDRPWVIKTTTYTAVAGDAIQADTVGGIFTITLPVSATVGDFIEIQDAEGTWATNNLTIARNGLKINGGTSDYTANVNGGKLSLVYISAGYGWSIK